MCIEYIYMIYIYSVHICIYNLYKFCTHMSTLNLDVYISIFTER